MVTKSHTSLFLESSIRDFDKIFKDKLNFKLGKLKKDTTISSDDKVKNLQSSIIKYFENINNRLNSYYSPLYKNITDIINNSDYQSLLDLTDGFEIKIYEKIMEKLSKDKTVKLEATDFKDRNIYDDISDTIQFIMGKWADRELDKKVTELKNNTTNLDSIHNNFKNQDQTPENLINFKKMTINELPNSLKDIINGIISISNSMKTEYIKEGNLKQLL